MTEIESQNLAIAHTFVERFLGKGDTRIAAQVLDKNVQVTTGLKPDGSINGREEYQTSFNLALYSSFTAFWGNSMFETECFT